VSAHDWGHVLIFQGKIGQGKRLIYQLIWDNASWHKSQAVRSWLREHNQTVKQSGEGVRILPCLLPVFDSPIVYSVLVSKFAEAA
jgi:hypothetical protein